MYSLIFYVKVAKGELKNNFIKYYSDLTRKEFYILFCLILLCLILGLFPNIVIDFISLYIEMYVLFIYKY